MNKDNKKRVEVPCLNVADIPNGHARLALTDSNMPYPVDVVLFYSDKAKLPGAAWTPGENGEHLEPIYVFRIGSIAQAMALRDAFQLVIDRGNRMAEGMPPRIIPIKH